MADVYPDGVDQRITDPEWIKRADGQSWVALTKDYSVIRDHRHVLADTTLRVFAFNNANLTGPELVARLESNFNRILAEGDEARTIRVGDHAEWLAASMAKSLK